MRGEHTLQKAFYRTGGYLKRKAPTILTCAGAIGVVGTSVLTAKATTKVSKLLEQATEEKGEKLTVWETIDISLPSYFPALLAGTATIACIFGANVINKRRQATLLSAYGMLDQVYKEYRAKVNDIYGPRR